MNSQARWHLHKLILLKDWPCPHMCFRCAPSSQHLKCNSLQIQHEQNCTYMDSSYPVTVFGSLTNSIHSLTLAIIIHLLCCHFGGKSESCASRLCKAALGLVMFEIWRSFAYHDSMSTLDISSRLPLVRLATMRATSSFVLCLRVPYSVERKLVDL